MAPRKSTNIKKKKAVTSKAKPAAKKKGSTPPPNPMEKLDRMASSGTEIATLGERRDNLHRLANETHAFDLKTHIPKLLKEHPNHNVYLVGGSPELSLDAKSSTPTLIAILVPNNSNDNHKSKPPPPFLAYSVKDEFVLEDLSKHQLHWVNVAPRVSILKSTKRMTKASIRALTEDNKAMEEHIQLWTIVPRDKLKRNKAGKYDIRFVNFSVPDKEGNLLHGDFEKGGEGLQAYLDMFVEEYENELGEDARENVETAIREAFSEARDKLEEHVAILNKAGYDEPLLDAITTVKIYPAHAKDAEKRPYINKYYGKAQTVL